MLLGLADRTPSILSQPVNSSSGLSLAKFNSVIHHALAAKNAPICQCLLPYFIGAEISLGGPRSLANPGGGLPLEPHSHDYNDYGQNADYRNTAIVLAQQKHSSQRRSQEFDLGGYKWVKEKKQVKQTHKKI